MSALSPARRPVFDSDALEMVVQRADGLISRLFPMVVAIEAMASETDQTRVTTALIAAAVERLEGGPDSPEPASAGDSDTATTTRASFTAEDGYTGVIGTTGALAPLLMIPRRRWRVARMSGTAVALLGCISMAGYWLTPLGIDQIWAGMRTASEDRDDKETAAPGTAIVIRLPVSVPRAGRNAPDYHSAMTLQAIAAPLAPADDGPSPFSGPASIAARGPTLRTRMVEMRPAPSAFVTRAASKGTWLFPPNANG